MGAESRRKQLETRLYIYVRRYSKQRVLNTGFAFCLKLKRFSRLANPNFI
jgi:hypothetical protein